MQNSSSETVEKTFESMFGKERHGWVRCYGRTITPSILKENQEVVAVQKAADVKINGMKKKIQTYEAIMKLLVKEQNSDLNDGCQYSHNTKGFDEVKQAKVSKKMEMCLRLCHSVSECDWL